MDMATESKNTAGEVLRQGRLKQRLSIVECAKRTHIATRYLEAIEEEHWDILPSESHRLGFIKLYSRFLGVPIDDVLALYNQKTLSSPNAASSKSELKAGDPEKPRIRTAPRPAHWSPTSIPQVIGLAIFILLLSWLIYHAVSPRIFEQNPMPWTRRRSPHQARLVAPRAAITVQKVRLKADSDSWLRVTSKNELLFEGILPAGSVKEWSGTGPFQFKIGNIRAISLFWNDQPVDVTTTARGSSSEIRIPPQ